jgi:hypothetical protein
MATTFDVNRIGGGTFELVQDPTTGKYTIKQVGFTPVKKLTLPDYTTAASTAGTTDTSKATTTATEETIKQQTTEAFKPAGGGEAIDYTGGEMLSQAQLQKEAKKIDPQVDTSTTTLGIARPTMRDIAGDTTEQQKQETPYQDAIMRGGVGVKAAERTVPGIIVDRKTPTRPEYSFTRPSGIDAPMTTGESALGISKVEPSATRTAKEADFASGTIPSKTTVADADVEADIGTVARADIEVEPTALKKVSTGLKTLADSVGTVLTSGPLAQIAKVIGKPVGESAGAVALNKTYFNVRGGSVDGQRIAGNPATDLYAGMNRVSRYGNLEKAGDKRIETREATAKRKGYTKDNDPTGFVAKTENMKNQARDYKAAKKSAPVTGTTKPGTSGGSTATGGGGGGGGGGSSRVICTELHKTGEMLTEDWVRDIRFTYSKLTKKHIKGYLSWAVPTVRHIKKYPTYRKIWKHIAQHRANDIAWRMKQGKFDLLGRIYAGIGEPLCWLIGNFVTDKTYNDIIAKGKRHI